MTPHEQAMFNDALDGKRQAELQLRIVNRLHYRLMKLKRDDRFALLRKIEHLIDTGKLPPEHQGRSALDAEDIAFIEGTRPEQSRQPA